MHRSMLLGGLVLLIGVTGTGEAKTLEDVLREKGVITEQEYATLAKTRTADYRIGEGFSYTSPDERFRGSLGSCLQLRYSLTDLDDVNNTAARQASDSSRFELRRIKLYFNGYAYSKDLTYKLQLNFANINGGSTSNGGILEETFINYRFLDGVQVRFGQDKVQFGRQFITSSAYQQFPDLSVVTTAFVPGYDTGLMVHGKLAGGLASYNIGGYGGLGQNTFRTTSDNAFTARLMLNPLGELKYSESDVEYSEKPLASLAGNFFRDTVNASEQNSATVTNNQLSFNARGRGWFALGNPLFLPARQIAGSESVDYNTAGFDAAFKWRGFSAQGEYFFARASGQASGNVAKAEGFYLQTGYFVIPRHLELAARYSYLDPNRDLGHDLWTEATGCVSWYVSGHNLKVQSDYTRIHRQQAIASTAGSHPTDDNQVRIQAQLIF